MDTYRNLARLLRLIAHPDRLRILAVLRCQPECVCHLSAALHRSQPYISQHLATLRHAGLIVDEKDGNNVFYRLADEDVARQLTAVLASAAGPAGLDLSDTRRAVAGCPCPRCRQAA
jgi:ArsR family transcriptional regulator